jgi:tRNA A-37 threonylcarbamoyl transferase component Bud32
VRKLAVRQVNEDLVTWRKTTLACGDAMLSRCRLKSQCQALTVFVVGNTGLEKVLTNCPDFFLHKKCRIIKSEKKIQVGYVPLRIRGEIRGVYLKWHHAVSFGHRVASLFVASAAMRSLSGAAVLLQAGYATAQPIAALEYRRRGVLRKSLYLSEEVTGAKTVENFWREDLIVSRGTEGYRKRRAFLRALARLFKSLHKDKIYHNDLKASNILVYRAGSAENTFVLIDLQGLRRCFYVSKRRRIKNLAQLNRTLGVYATRTEKLYFVKTYGEDRPSNRMRKRDLVQSILVETSRQFLKGRLRRSQWREKSLTLSSAATRLANKR